MILKYDDGSMSTRAIMKKMKIKSVCLLIASCLGDTDRIKIKDTNSLLGLAKAGLKVYWMSLSSQHAIPKGVQNVDELNRHHLDYPPDDFGDVSHLTYLGYGHGVDANSLLVSDLNDRANEYGFDSYIIPTDRIEFSEMLRI